MPAGHDEEEKDGEERPEPKCWRARACIIAATVGVAAVVAEAPSWEEGGEGRPKPKWRRAWAHIMTLELSSH